MDDYGRRLRQGTDWSVAVEFAFENGDVVIEAVPDDDPISVHRSHGPLDHWPDCSTRTSSSHPALSCAVRWAWLLTNHQGFEDGVQIEFASDPAVNLQFVTVASRLFESDVVART